MKKYLKLRWLDNKSKISLYTSSKLHFEVIFVSLRKKYMITIAIFEEPTYFKLNRKTEKNDTCSEHIFTYIYNASRHHVKLPSSMNAKQWKTHYASSTQPFRHPYWQHTWTQATLLYSWSPNLCAVLSLSLCCFRTWCSPDPDPSLLIWSLLLYLFAPPNPSEVYNHPHKSDSVKAYTSCVGVIVFLFSSLAVPIF